MGDQTVPARRILYGVGPDDTGAEATASALADALDGPDVTVVAGRERCLAAVDESRPDGLVAAGTLADEFGADLADALADRWPDLPVVLFVAPAAVDPAAVDRAEHRPALRLVQDAGAGSAEVLAATLHGLLGDGPPESGPSARPVERTLERVTDAFFALNADWEFTFVNERAEELLARSESELLGRNVWTEFPEAAETAFQTQYERAMETGEPVTFEEYYPPLATWFEVTAYPSPSGLSVYFRDVTAAKERADRLEALSRRAGRLPEAETGPEIAGITVDAAAEVLGLDRSYVALYDEGEGRLRVVARTDGLERRDDLPLVGDVDSSPVWEAYVDGERRVRVASDGPAAGAERVAAFPLGRHGALVGLRAGPDGFGADELSLAEILAALARSSFDRAARETDLREQRDALERKTRRLERVERVNRAIREITRALVRAESRAEIERRVCETLAGIDPYAFAWVGRRDPATDEVVPAASAGAGAGYLDEVTVTADETETGRGPAGRAVRSGEPQMQNSLVTDAEFEPWRQEALSRGFQSVASVPIRYRETDYGVLNLYSETPGAFEPMESAVLEELGHTIGYAVRAVERKRSLVNERSVEVTLRVDLDGPVLGFVDGSEGTFAVEDTVQGADGDLHLFFEAEGVDPDAVADCARRSLDVTDVRVVRDDRSGRLYDCTVDPSAFLPRLHDRGVVVDRFVVDGGRADVTLRVPHTADVRELVERFEAELGSTELTSRRERDDSVMDRREFEDEVRSRLTARQAEVLRTAYLAGFFEWPRRSNGQEVAEMLGVTQPTVNRHIRAGERTVFDVLFGDDAR